MTDSEKALFTGILMNSRHYLEFGSGGSTCLAASLVTGSVTSVDSSREWHERVRDECIKSNYAVQPALVFADIGETGDWGWPVDSLKRDNWPSYHSAVWDRPGSESADLYLVDGRFRVACFMQVALHSQPNALIAIHDFAGRAGYQIVKEVANELQIAETLSIFRKSPAFDAARASAILAEYAYQPE